MKTDKLKKEIDKILTSRKEKIEKITVEHDAAIEQMNAFKNEAMKSLDAEDIAAITEFNRKAREMEEIAESYSKLLEKVKQPDPETLKSINHDIRAAQREVYSEYVTELCKKIDSLDELTGAAESELIALNNLYKQAHKELDDSTPIGLGPFTDWAAINSIHSLKKQKFYTDYVNSQRQKK